jgi:superkiller protein 3
VNLQSNRLSDRRREVATTPSPNEGSRLEAAMQRADDLLAQSLKNDEQTKRRRRRRRLVWSISIGAIMIAFATILILALSGGPKQGEPQSAAALEQAGWTAWQAGKLDEARDKFSRAVKLDPKLVNAWNGLGWAQLNGGNADEGEKAFRKALELEPNFPAALNGVGQISFSRRQYDKAEKELLQAAPSAPAAWWTLARIYLLQGKFDEARKWAQKTVDSPGGKEAEPLLAAAKSGKLDDNLRKQIEPPRPVSPEVQRGWDLLNSGSAEAKAAFEAAIKKNPNDADAHNGLGFYLLNSGRLDEAKREFETTLKLDPDAAGAMNGLARVLDAQGKTDEAIRLWEKMVAQNPEPNAGTFGLAQAYLKKKDYAKALKLYEQLAQAMPDNPDVQAGLKEARHGAGH